MSRMKDLFGDTPYLPRQPHQLVRPGDPGPSHRAASKVILKLRKLQKAVYDALIDAGPFGLTDYELEERFNNHGATYRTRRAELVELGLVYDTGRKRVIRGTLRTVWAATAFIPGGNYDQSDSL